MTDRDKDSNLPCIINYGRKKSYDTGAVVKQVEKVEIFTLAGLVL